MGCVPHDALYDTTCMYLTQIPNLNETAVHEQTCAIKDMPPAPRQKHHTPFSINWTIACLREQDPL
jgi:hypothetical protein